MNEFDVLLDDSDRSHLLAKNPRYVARNHLLQKCIDKAEEGDYSFVEEYLEVLTNPYDEGTLEQQSKWGMGLPDGFIGAKCSCSS